MSTTKKIYRITRILCLLALLVGTFVQLGCQTRVGAGFPRKTTHTARTHVPFTNVATPGPSLALLPEATTTDVPLLTAPAEAQAAPPIRMWTDWQGELLPGYLRSKRAHEARLPIVTELFQKAGVAFPPKEIAFVVYKQQKHLEVWASNETGGRAAKIATYGICAASGRLGPKRYEGDLQVPEGFYKIQYGWAESNYHLEMKVSYPNMVDKVLGPKNRPLGGEIMIHGACASIGCMAMGDERAEELWVMMKAMGDGKVQVHIYPSRDMDGLLAAPEHAKHHSFWKNLKEGRDLFEREQRIMRVKADWHGEYMFE